MFRLENFVIENFNNFRDQIFRHEKSEIEKFHVEMPTCQNICKVSILKTFYNSLNLRRPN